MNYRFTNGNLKGHSFGNLLLTALEKSTGSFDKAIEAKHKVSAVDIYRGWTEIHSYQDYAKLLERFPVADLTIEEPPIEDIIRQVFSKHE